MFLYNLRIMLKKYIYWDFQRVAGGWDECVIEFSKFDKWNFYLGYTSFNKLQ